MVTITKPESPTVNAEPRVALAPAISTQDIETEIRIEELTPFLAPVQRKSLLARMVHGLVAFYDWLSGPPMTSRDRVLRDIAEARPQVYHKYVA